ncbi:sterol desaturase family protein [Seonamhaeicola maritimus]|uniref:Sterol desaturase family protein n=1 Tax=Seonamhaeicola maritimus TaxID=2591822 RepID=A0A5C7GEF9_9FLAO|nr:sterol desaturase family protein [Seonamhaeicola maritimus]TXG34544.1 sterol desaturase family protein [Seonamhaeicola maritimus]
MEHLISYFENIPSHHRAILIIGGLTIFWIIEGIIPLFKFKYNKWRHALPNLFFNLTLMLVNFPLAFMLLKTSDWVRDNDFGIINWLPEMSLGLYAFLGVFFLDFFGAYLPHLIEHKVKPLWMVHLVHHTDHKVDTTTANRHHPIESVIRFFFTLLGVFVVGTPIGIVFLYQTVSVIATQFSHANIKLPKRVDKAISYVLVSPDMHKVHHHFRLPYTDSNYGNIFSVWDRLLGTYMELNPDKIVYGVDVFPDEKKNQHIGELLKQPFQKYDKPTVTPGED